MYSYYQIKKKIIVILFIFSVTIFSKEANMSFIQKSFNVPLKLNTESFILEILTPKVGTLDYDAVMSSKERLRGVFAPKTKWPSDDMTLEQNIADLERHEKEFYAREAFAYTVLSLDRKRCLGCVYIDPPSISEFDCEVYLWLRDDAIDLDHKLLNTVKKWLYKNWGMERVVFPGREIDWPEWNILLKKNISTELRHR